MPNIEVPNNSIVTYQSRWEFASSLFYGGDKVAVMNQVSQRLSQSGIVLRNYRQLDANLSSYEVELILQIVNGTGFAKLADVASIVANGVYLATDKLPVSYSIPSIKRPNDLVTTSTGQPSAAPTGDAPKSWWDSFVSKLETFSIGGLVGIVAVTGALVIGFGLITAKKLSPV